MSEYRLNAATTAGPAHEGLPGQGGCLRIRLRLFDVPGPDGRPDRPDVVCDLPVPEARRLALQVLDAADHAQRLHRDGILDRQGARR